MASKNRGCRAWCMRTGKCPSQRPSRPSAEDVGQRRTTPRAGILYDGESAKNFPLDETGNLSGICPVSRNSLSTYLTPPLNRQVFCVLRRACLGGWPRVKDAPPDLRASAARGFRTASGINSLGACGRTHHYTDTRSLVAKRGLRASHRSTAGTPTIDAAT